MLPRGCGELEEHYVEAGDVQVRVYAGGCVYPPGDDTELLIEALAALRDSGRRYDSIVEIGVGSGAVSAAAAEIFRPSRQACCDLFYCPVAATRAAIGEGRCLYAICNSCNCLKPGWDLAVLNPPYLPEEPPEEAEPYSCGEDAIQGWWSGSGGVMEYMVRQAFRLAREIVIVYSSLSPVDPLEMARRAGRPFHVMVEDSFFMEKLRVAWIGPPKAGTRGY